MEGILLEIMRFKQELDAIDEELYAHLQTTNHLDAQILKNLDSLKNFTEEEKNCERATIIQENQLQRILILTDRSHEYLFHEKRNLQNIEEALRYATSEIRDGREHFISNCKLFQKHVENISEERKKLLLEKDSILKKILQLTGDVDSMEASHALVLQGDRTYNENLIYENKDLPELVQECEKHMLEIECQVNTFKDLQALNDRLLGEIEDNEEAIRQLKDLVVGLEIQLSHLTG